MGNDGGTIVSRKDLLASSERKETKTNVPFEYCRLSSFPLKSAEHIVGDAKGNLYIKSKLIERLLENKRNKPTEKSAFAVKSLKDVVDVRMHFNGDIVECPVTRDTPRIFAYSFACGCLVAYGVLKGTNECANCSTIYEDCDVVIANPQTEEHKAFNKLNEKNRRSRRKLAKEKDKQTKRPPETVCKHESDEVDNTGGEPTLKKRRTSN